MRTISTNLDAVRDKRVLIRCNFDIPLSGSKVGDDTRVLDALDTIKKVTEVAAQVILIAHLGRPDGNYDPRFSLKPVAHYLEGLLRVPLLFVPYLPDWKQLKLPSRKIILLDNLRFYPQEETPNETFSRWLSSLAEVYINECFATSHRDHTSITRLPKLLESYGGLHLEKEINVLSKIRLQPKKPLVVIMGGAKLETKMPLIKYFLPIADHVLIGGKLAIELTATDLRSHNLTVAELTPSTRDITSTSAAQFAEIITDANTVIWNGTMGVVEEKENQAGTYVVAKALDQTSAYTVVGGGDTEAALTFFNLESSIDHICSGGGAMLEYLATGTLVGIQALS